MTGQAHWIDLVPILLGAVAIALLLWRDACTERRFRIDVRRLLCPNLRRKVVATLVRSIPTGTVLGVRRCTGSPNPDLVTCGKQCIAGFGHGGGPIAVQSSAKPSQGPPAG